MLKAYRTLSVALSLLLFLVSPSGAQSKNPLQGGQLNLERQKKVAAPADVPATQTLPVPVPNLPAGISIDPPAGSQQEAERPTISISFGTPESVRYDMTRLWVNGSEVTGNCLKAPTFVSYRPFVALPSGPVTVRAKIYYIDLDPQEFSWTFNLQRSEAIKKIQVTSPHELQTYEDLQVELQGRPHGKAWFEIEDYRYDIPLVEDPQKPGTYKGYYRVRRGDSRLRAQIIGHLELEGQTYSLRYAEPVAIWGQLFKVVVTDPPNGGELPLNFKTKGRTAPNCNISIVPKIGFSDTIDPANRISETDSMGSIPCESDAEGNFEADYGFLIKLPGMHCVFTITATNAQGERSVPYILRVKFK